MRSIRFGHPIVVLAMSLLMCISSTSFGFTTGVTLSVTIASGNLNIREKPDGESKIVGKVSKDKTLLFQMEISGDWLKVRYCEYADNTDGVTCLDGWVNKQYVDCPYFHSSIIEQLKLEEEFGSEMYGVNGLLFIMVSDQEAYAQVNGKKILLTTADGSGQRFSAKELSIELVMFQTEMGYESESGVGFLRIEKAGKVEYVFVTGSFGV